MAKTPFIAKHGLVLGGGTTVDASSSILTLEGLSGAPVAFTGTDGYGLSGTILGSLSGQLLAGTIAITQSSTDDSKLIATTEFVQDVVAGTGQLSPALSARLNNTYSTLNANSATWAINIADLTSVANTSANWDSTYSTVNAFSAVWEDNRLDLTEVANTSATWDSVYTSVTDNSASWDSAYTTTYNNSASWDNGGGVYTTVNENSATWSVNAADITEIASTSADWNSTYTTTNENSAGWTSIYSTTNSNSSSWTSTHTDVNANSAFWDQTYSTVYNNSGGWGTAAAGGWTDAGGHVHVSNHGIDRVVIGSNVNPNTLFEVVSSTGGIMSLRRVESAIAADDVVGEIRAVGKETVDQIGAKISFVASDHWETDSDTTDAPTQIQFWTAQNGEQVAQRMTLTDAGSLGVGTTTPNETLTVVGNISASGNIFLSSGPVGVGTGSGDAGTTTTVRENSANWTYVAENSGSGDNHTTTTVSDNSANWQSTYNQVQDASTDLNVDSGTLVVDKDESRVGIGTTTPAKKLHINSGTNDVGLRIESTDAYAKIELGDDSTGMSNVWFGAHGSLAVMTASNSNNSDLVINSSGNVGIGVTDPGALLTVAGTASAKDFVTEDGNSDGWTATKAIVDADYLNWNYVAANSGSGGKIDSAYSTVNEGSATWDSTYSTVYAESAQWGAGSSKWTNDGSGNIYRTSRVGINKADPTYTLDVEGTMRVSDTALFNGNVTFAGTTSFVQSTNLNVSDKSIIINYGSGASTGGQAGIYIEESGDDDAGYFRTTSDRGGWELKEPAGGNVLTLDINSSKTFTIAGALGVESDSLINQDLTTDSTGVTFAKLGIGSAATNNVFSLAVSGTDAALMPVGTTAQRPSTVTSGLFRYNTDTNQFEGYSNAAWSGLGGTADGDADTKIVVDLVSDDDVLRFNTAGSEKAQIDDLGNMSIGTTVPSVSGLTIAGHLSASGSLQLIGGTSDEWISTRTSVNANSANWDSVYTTTNDNSARWEQIEADITEVANTSATWDSVYTSVTDNSATWDSVYTSVSDSSGTWDSVYATVFANSGSGTSGKLLKWGSDGLQPEDSLVSESGSLVTTTGSFKATSDITADGNISTSQLTTTSFADIVYAGTARPALVVQSSDASADVVEFKSGSTSLFKIFGNDNIAVGSNIGATGTYSFAICATDALRLPVGTTAERPTADAGLIRYNLTNNQLENSDGTTWNSIGTGVVDADNDTKIFSEITAGGDDDTLFFETGGTRRLSISGTVVKPHADNTIDLGTSTNEFKDLYLTGTANIDSLVADTADINGGTIDNTIIGNTTPTTGTFSGVTVAGNLSASDVITTKVLNVSGTSHIAGVTTLENAVINAVALDQVSTFTASSDLDFGAYDITAKRWISTIATGNAPFNVSSTTVVTNLNADQLDGQHAPSGTIVGTSDSQTLTNKTLTSPTINTATIEGGTIGATTAATEATIDNIKIDGTTIGHTSDTDLLTLTSGKLTVAGAIDIDQLILDDNTPDKILVGDGTSYEPYTIAGDISVSRSGSGGSATLTMTLNSAVTLGSGTEGAYVASLGTGGTGTTIINNPGTEGATPSVSVNYGSSSSTAVEGNTTITLNGTSNEVEITGTAAQALGGGPSYTIGLPDDVTIGNDLTVDNDLTVTGDLTVNGDTVTVNTATLSVEDPLIILANGNNSADTVDIGLYGLYDTSGSQDLYAGLFRDATDNKWKLFNDLQVAPTTTVNTGGTGYTVSTLVAHLEDSNTTITGGNIDGTVIGDASPAALSATSVDVTGATASRLVATDANKRLESVNLSSWVAGTSNQVSVANDGDGSITLSTPQNIHAAATPTFAGLTITGNVSASDVITTKHANLSGELHVTSKIGIGTNNPATSLDVSSTDAIVIPVGTTAQRPSAETGMIRFDSDKGQFEGYNGTGWAGLGGVIDADQDTKIVAEESSDEDKLRFDTAGSERMIITETGLVGVGTSLPDENLTVAGNISASNIIYTSGGTSKQWESTYTTVTSKEANWDTGYNQSQLNKDDLTNVADTSANWNWSYNNALTGTDLWNGAVDDVTNIANTSASWNNAYSSVKAVTADVTNLANASGNWDWSHENALSGTDNWNTAYTQSQTNQTDIAAVVADMTNVANTSATWNGVVEDMTNVANASADWNSTYTTTNNNSAVWSHPLSSFSTSETITITNSFSAGCAIRLNTDGTYDKSLAGSRPLGLETDSLSAEVLGVVQTATSSDFEIVYSGTCKLPSHGLGDPGVTLFLSHIHDGLILSAHPTQSSAFEKPIGTIIDSDTILVQNYRGEKLSATQNNATNWDKAYSTVAANSSTWGGGSSTGIANNNLVGIDSDSSGSNHPVQDDDYARFTPAGLEGRSVSEVAGDIGSSITTVGTIGTGTWQGTAIADDYIASASTWNGKQDALTFGISNTNAVKIDGNEITDNEYARFTANGLESRTAAEVAADIEGNIDAVGTIASGTWQGTAIADAFVANDLTISGGTVDNSVVGGSTPAAGSFTTLKITTPGSAPTNPTSTGTKGQIVYDDNYVYICVATNTWRRAALAAW